MIILAAITVIASYLVGSIPTGLLVGLYGYGVDIRKTGSGNIGSTNALRALGTSAAIIVLVGDITKGFLAVSFTSLFFADAPTFVANIVSLEAKTSTVDALVVVLAAIAAMLGNNFSIYIKFHGGKGIGIATGIILAMTPIIAIVLFFVWLVVFVVSRYVSLGSVIIALLFPLLMYYFYGHVWPYVVFSVAASVLALIRHRSNIQRLLTGTELRFGDQAKE